MNADDRIVFTKITPGEPGRYPADYSLVGRAFPVFDLPIYHESIEDWKAREFQAIDKRMLQYAASYSIDPNEARDSHVAQAARAQVNPNNWEFNHCVGWIRLWAGSVIWAECWLPLAKRVHRRRSPHSIVPYGEIFRIQTLPTDTSEDRFRLIKLAFIGLAALPPFSRRYVDLARLERVGTYVNWKVIESQVMVENLVPQLRSFRRNG